MKRYCIKCRTGRLEYFEIISENDDGYIIRITKLSDGNERIVEETMSKHLFNICVKTGYIFQLEKAVSSAA